MMQSKSKFLIERVTESPPPPAAEPLPLVTLVILSFNRKEQLRTTLRKVTTELQYPPDKKEIIVVDNASTDGSAGMVRVEFPGVTLHIEPRNVGISGWNFGFERGRGEFFLALDNDCYMDGDALLRAVANAKGHSADIVSFTILQPSEPGFSFNRQHNVGLMSFWGCAALFGRPVIRALQGFDPGIFVNVHEAEFCLRAFDQGFKHLFCPVSRPGT